MALAAFLLGVLLLIGALLVWQQASRRTQGAVFGVEDAVVFIATRLTGEIRDRVKESDIRRIVEWEVYYLRGLAQKDRRAPVVTVAGDFQPAVNYIREQASERHGLEYSELDIKFVLNLGGEYIRSIGAVGMRADVEVFENDG